MRLFNTLLVLAVLLDPSAAYSDIVALTAAPDPVRQGTSLEIRARVDRAGTVYFFFKGRPFGNAVQARGAGVVSTRDIVPGNTVPAGHSAISKSFSAQQFGQRVSNNVTVTR